MEQVGLWSSDTVTHTNRRAQESLLGRDGVATSIWGG